MSRKGEDSVFQLSLTEIVLALTFLLLLLLGLMYITKANEVEVLQEEVNQAKSVANYEQLEVKFSQLKEKIEAYLRDRSLPNPDAILDDLVSVVRYEAEIKRLTELLASSSESEASCKLLADRFEEDVTEELIKRFAQNQLSLEAAIKELRRQGMEVNSEAALISQARDNIFEIQRLKKKCGGGAIGPCWVNAQGRTENLLSVTLENDHISVQLADLSPARRAELVDIPGIDLATRPIIPYSEFEASFGPILKWSKSRNPECRHYVAITSNVPLTKDSTPRRMQVQNYFYPDETRLK